jgi:hypothetical protein
VIAEIFQYPINPKYPELVPILGLETPISLFIKEEICPHSSIKEKEVVMYKYQVS